MIVLPASARISLPWKNGGGTTTNIAVFPRSAGTDDFHWRVSVAAIESDGAFSLYPGVDRILMPLSPGGLVLRDGEARYNLPRYEPFCFAGERRLEAVEVSRSSLDLNLMTRRGVVLGTLVPLRVDGVLTLSASPGEMSLIVVVEGTVVVESTAAINPATTLTALDAAELSDEEALLRGKARIVLVRLSDAGPQPS